MLKLLKQFLSSPVFAGAIGGIATRLIEISGTLMHDTTTQRNFDFGFVVGMLILSGLGGALVFFINETKLYKAFLLGISAPALIHAAAETAPQIGTKVQPAVSAIVALFVQDAHANPTQGGLQASSTANNFIQLNALNASSSFSVVFLDNNGQNVGSAEIPSRDNRFIGIPFTATSVRFEKGTSVSQVLKLDQISGLLVFSVSLTSKAEYGLAQAFGQSPKITYEFSVKVDKLPFANPNSSGWISAGSLENGNWSSSYLHLDGAPSPGMLGTMIYMIDLRAQASQNAPILAVLVPQQRVKILQIQIDNATKNSWLQVQILP